MLCTLRVLAPGTEMHCWAGQHCLSPAEKNQLEIATVLSGSTPASNGRQDRPARLKMTP
jgi:hypothetical protein